MCYRETKLTIKACFFMGLQLLTMLCVMFHLHHLAITVIIADTEKDSNMERKNCKEIRQMCFTIFVSLISSPLDCPHFSSSTMLLRLYTTVIVGLFPFSFRLTNSLVISQRTQYKRSMFMQLWRK